MAEDKQNDFVHLHVHTEYSLLDGAAKIDGLFKRCGELGQSAVAITDHGNLFGAFAFVKKAVSFTDPKADVFEFLASGQPFRVKPIIGSELYVCDDMQKREVGLGGKMPKLNHLVLLAKNEVGYHNLVKLVSFGYTKGMYYKPRIDMALLRQHKEGLICLSACLAGALPQAILEGDLRRANAIAKEFHALFGEDYYIELQDHNLKAQKRVLPHLVEIARSNNIQMVCTNDAHYLTRDDSAMQKVLQCISFRRTLDPSELDKDDEGMLAEGGTEDDSYFPTREFYVKSRAEMEQLFGAIPAALDNTVKIADKCDCRFFCKKPLLPLYEPPTGETPPDFLRRLTYEGLERNYPEVTKEVRERADYELSVIERMGFVEYFLIVWDFIYYSAQQGIPVGPGRGSGVGSIVAYALGITRLDPLKYNLLFERFLNPERVSSPDFDIDFCVDRREEVIDYVDNKYGHDNVSRIVTFGTLAAKAAVKDVGRVFSHPYSEVDKITKQMPAPMPKDVKLADLVGQGKNPAAVVPDLKAMYDADPQVKRIFDMASKIEGMPRQTGVHAAGVIICRDPIFEHVPLARAKAKGGKELVTTEFDMVECESLGLLKMDFLGLRTLTDIKKAQDIILKTSGKQINFYEMEYDDKGVFELIGEGDTHAVFQLESEGMKRFMRDLKPTVFEDIIAGVALYRPGPMDNIPQYVRGKRSPERIVYDHPLLEPVLNVTYGIMVYQEQVMQAVRVLAGYTLGRADELRRMISKKKMDKMEAEREVFLHGSPKDKIPGAVKNGVSEQVANKIFDDIVKFADYAFNKSHAAVYAALAYQTAYLKRYHTVEFITAVLNNRISKIEEVTNYLRYLKEKSIAVLPPDINKSEGVFTVENGAVRIGMVAIKNVGTGVIDAIVQERQKNGKYRDFEDFVTRLDAVTLNKRMLESLILAGTFDCFGNARAQLMQVYEGVLARAAKDREAKKSGQFSFFDLDAGFGAKQKVPYPEVREFDQATKLQYEKEVAGVYLTGHPLDEYRSFLVSFPYNSSHLASKSGDEDEAEVAYALDDELDTAETGLEDGVAVSLGGMLTQASRRITKQGRELGVGLLEDLNGTVELLVSGYTLKKYASAFAKDKLVTITGKVKRDDRGTSVWVDSITEFGGSMKAATRKICFFVSGNDPKLVDELQEILLAYPGDDETFMRFKDEEGKTYPLEINVRVCDMLLAEVCGLLGNDCYKIV